jgi:hypothetical protein
VVRTIASEAHAGQPGRSRKGLVSVIQVPAVKPRAGTNVTYAARRMVARCRENLGRKVMIALNVPVLVQAILAVSRPHV